MWFISATRSCHDSLGTNSKTLNVKDGLLASFEPNRDQIHPRAKVAVQRNDFVRVTSVEFLWLTSPEPDDTTISPDGTRVN